jgi:hypothetical protein
MQASFPGASSGAMGLGAIITVRAVSAVLAVIPVAARTMRGKMLHLCNEEYRLI